ncbi:hypothetical protein B9Z55_007714 [Caenorhabditis nigoni]|uniref:Uncharacterized protein n=1 Tax=Caenorhabditis nigoni TaxID=1611254 RepID=A0A2G5VAX5_9PELO|nr:hypothetical protein B9Z55_007714 [Caenorhabditis nigoni]
MQRLLLLLQRIFLPDYSDTSIIGFSGISCKMATDGEVNGEKEPASTEMLESMQALENLKITVTEAINKNKQNFDELSDKLQSIEASIEKISKSNDAENTRDNPSEEQIDEPKVCTNVSLVRIDFLRDLDFFRNTTNVTYEKRFKLKPVFKNVKKFKEHKQNSSVWEDHYNAKW